jgi:presenilin-like A22 family membrane protease
MRAVAVLLFLFLIVQLLGLLVGNRYLGFVSSGEVEPLFSNPQSPWNSLYLFAALLPLTLLLILLLKFRRNWFRVFELLVVFFCCWLALDLLLGFQVGWFSSGFLMALLLVGWRAARPTPLNQDLVLILSASGVGAVLGVSLGVAPSLLLLALFSLYDYFSVFISRHMVFMARRLVPFSSSLLLSVPSDLRDFVRKGEKGRRAGRRVLHLGGGDLILPLIFSVSVLSAEGLASSLLVSLSSSLFLLFLLLLLSRRPGSILPGLPFLSTGCLLGFLLSRIL